MTLKLIIAGSRNITDAKAVRRRIHDLLSVFDLQPSEIVSGTAVGPDKIGETYADIYSMPIKRMPADWNTHGKAAGPIRNRKMAEYADMAIVFWDGESRGSLNMINEMSRVNKPCLVEIMKPTPVVKYGERKGL